MIARRSPGESSRRRARCCSTSAALSSKPRRCPAGKGCSPLRWPTTRRRRRTPRPWSNRRRHRLRRPRRFALEGRHVAPLRAARADPRRVLGRFRRRRLAGERPRRGGGGRRRALPAHGPPAQRRQLRVGMIELLDAMDAAGVPVGIVSNALSGQVHLDWLAEHGLDRAFRRQDPQRRGTGAQTQPGDDPPRRARARRRAGRGLVRRRQLRPRRALRPARRDRRQSS